ncbi:hypothetical protein XENOCAPTIV_030911, partial [Xenoophorus captivus]
HKDAYQAILDGVKGGPKEKRLAAQFIPKFFSSFPELADAAINAQLDLCEDEDVSELPRFATSENIFRVADILTQLLQTGTLGGLFSQILQGEDIVRERAIKFLSTKLKTLTEDVMTKEVEEYVFAETKKVMEDVTGEEFVLLMRVVSGLRVLQSVNGRQQLVELVKNVHSTRFVTYFCENVLPNLSTLTSPVAELDIQLELGRKLPDFLVDKVDAERLKDFKIR